MHADRATRSVRLLALVFMFPVAIQGVYYTQRGLFRAYRFAFSELDRWNMHRLVDPGTQIETAPRIGYFLIWSVDVLLSTAAFGIGLFILNRLRRGRIVDDVTARALGWLGGTLAIARTFDQVFQAVNRTLITWFNVAGPMPPQWDYDPSDYKTLLLGILLYLFAGVMRQAILVERENQGFV